MPISYRTENGFPTQGHDFFCFCFFFSVNVLYKFVKHSPPLLLGLTLILLGEKISNITLMLLVFFCRFFPNPTPHQICPRKDLGTGKKQNHFTDCFALIFFVPVGVDCQYYVWLFKGRLDWTCKDVRGLYRKFWTLCLRNASHFLLASFFSPIHRMDLGVYVSW